MIIKTFFKVHFVKFSNVIPLLNFHLNDKVSKKIVIYKFFMEVKTSLKFKPIKLSLS